MTDPFATSIWEIAHPDGASIFVRHQLKGDVKKYVVFGPFLYASYEALQEANSTTGPHNLLAELNGKDVMVQQISKKWVVENALKQFDSVESDCIVIGDMLVPLSRQGAQWVDDTCKDAGWQSLVKAYGEDAIRVMGASLVGQMFDMSVLH